MTVSNSHQSLCYSVRGADPVIVRLEIMLNTMVTKISLSLSP